MFLSIDGKLIKELEKFTSKLKTIQALSAVSIRPLDDNKLEFAATDGCKLYTFIREKTDTESLDEQLVIVIPKVKGKYTYFLEKRNDIYVLRNPLTEENVLCQEIKDMKYPEYRAVIPLELYNIPYAQTYTAFKSENLAALEFVMPSAIERRPRTAGPNKPCFWRNKSQLGEQLVCLMPYHLIETKEENFMSTRCCVVVKQTFGKAQDADKTVKSATLYHHHDGYPQGVGYDLWRRLQKYTGHWDIDEVVNNLVKDQHDEYEYTAYEHSDIEYLYEIDCSAKTLKCYECQLVYQDENGNIVNEVEIGDEIPLNFSKEIKNGD